MARPKTKDLKESYAFRVYYDDELEVLNKAINMYRDKFASRNDTIKYIALIGADKLIGDNSLNNSINFSEIRRYMKTIEAKLEDIKGEQKLNFVETNAEIKTNQSLINLNTNILKKTTGINLNNYTQDWKYKPHNQYDVEELRDNFAEDILNGKS